LVDFANNMDYIVIITKPEVHLLEKDGKTVIFKSKVDARIESSKVKDSYVYPLYDILKLIDDLKRSNVPDYNVDSYSYYERAFKNLLREI